MICSCADPLSRPHIPAARPALPGSWCRLDGAQPHRPRKPSTPAVYGIGEPTQRSRRGGGADAGGHRQPASASRLGECWRLCQKSPGILCDVRPSGVHREKHLNLMTAKISVTMKRLLDPDSLRALSRGCAILGAGGGGDAYVTLLQVLQATEDFGPVPLVDLDELPDDALIMPCAGIGAPTVSVEKIENGDEGARLREHLQFMTGRRVAALMAIEIGGGNGLLPITWAARMGLPVVDADGIGRAFPEVPQV